MSSRPPELENGIITFKMSCSEHGEQRLKRSRHVGVLLSICLQSHQSSCSNVKSLSFTVDHNGFKDLSCVFSIVLAEHILGTDEWWFFTDYFVVVRLAAVCIGFWFGTYLSRAVSEQTWANLMLKRNMLHTKTIHNPYFVSYKSYNVSSLIPWFNSRRNSREGSEKTYRVWLIQELDSRSRFLLSGLGRRPQGELYFDELELLDVKKKHVAYQNHP